MKLSKLKFALLLLLALPAAALPASKALAVTGSDWQPGRIIDDQIFYNGSDMTPQQIQSFLKSRLPQSNGQPVCDNSGSQIFTGYYSSPTAYFSGAHTYTTSDNVHRYQLDSAYPAPYTCLYQYVEDTKIANSGILGSGGNNIGNPSWTPPVADCPVDSSGLNTCSAAYIIYNSAQQYNISSRALIVLLQKEQNIVTDDWPWYPEYKSATGYGCPDTSACSSTYYGFYNQVHNAAKQFRNYQQNPNNFNYVLGTNSILYNPNTACGSQQVNIVTQATAGLYDYTPYVPDQAALNNLYGTGDSCSSYGNRNFWRLFNDWFGSTTLPSYSWKYAGQTSSVDLTHLAVGQKATFTVSATNTGTATWTNSGTNPVRLGTDNPQDRSSIFATPSWLSSARPATMDQSSVAPGQTATFTFTIQAPNQPGTYKEYFNLLAEGITWMNDPGLYFGITVVSPTLSSTQVSNTLPSTVLTSSKTSITATVQNTSNVTWYNDGMYPVDLGTCNPQDRNSQFADSTWPGPNRPAHMNEPSVAPGQNATFTFTLDAPSTPAVYQESFCTVAENLAWFGTSLNLSIDVRGTYQAAAANNPATSLVAGQSTSVTLSFTNQGTATWTNSGTSPVRLGTANPIDRTSAFCDASWASCNRPATLNEASVAPGATGTFTFVLHSQPGMKGTYNEYFMPVQEGVQWFGSASVVSINVSPATYSWSLGSQGAYTDSSKTTGVDLTKLSPGQTAWLTLTATNTGNVTWNNSGSNPVRLGTSYPQDRSSRYATGAWIGPNRPVTLKEASVAPGATGTFEFPIQVPNGSGTFDEHFNLLVEGLQWMPDIGLMYHTVERNGYSWSLASQYAYTDSGKTTPADLTNLAKGQTVFIGFTARNTGTATWYNTGAYPVDLGTSNPRDRNSAFASSGWLGANRPARLKEASVAPGQIGTFEFNFTAPQTAGTYHEYFDPVAEGITWLNDIGLNFYTVVH